MPKKILILVVSSLDHPYLEMVKTSLRTWDSISVNNCETVYYFGEAVGKVPPIPEWYEHKMIVFPYKESYSNMGYKLLSIFDWVLKLKDFEWSLKMKDFDYIVRVNSSCYVDKKQLAKYIETLPETNLFAGVEVDKGTDYDLNWCWGGMQFILSKDVVQKVVDNKELFNHNHIEDVALSHVVSKLGIPFYKGTGCSINEKDGKWLLLGYNSPSIEFENFEDIKPLQNHFYRVKVDRDRQQDKYLMETLFKTLNPYNHIEFLLKNPTHPTT